ncbi:DNA polymerase IV [Nitrosomonas sp. JL21]|uniref:DNA polymerase IV n=1 Tax=Nitrosomonas sp. JL21 TaxID=153949 RepID=UPI00136AF98A|nr:DNA polymerase IV [Nitrosomonas sp. JL21]MBL8498645.1 DNA polymerase IV [Nitrosomonas sp.]MCC7091091.1 DNA polymerase IV [Nitrosomonas sp.]MXS79040.1 DNA polymerase IV [Nitrosomonas sp. JL21]
MNAPTRRIAHLDMDAFYASVELSRYPELRGQPVVIAGRIEHEPIIRPDGSRHFFKLRDYTGRGVVTTATYEARALGVFSAMGVMKAAQLAPDAILLPADFDRYRHYSRLFKAAVATIAPHIEDSGIDEIYIDLNDLVDDALTLGQRIKQVVQEATGLTCSMGISPNKLLSKICSDLDKPDGLVIIQHADIAHRIWPLSVSKINGIGPKAAKKLESLGIHTIAQLAQTDPGLLQTHFGRSYSAWLNEVSHGIDDRPVVTHADPKSLSRETTFERDLHPCTDRDVLSETFAALCRQIAEDLQQKALSSRTISIKLRFEDFQTVTRDFTLTSSTSDAAIIRIAARECLRRVQLRKKIRLLGVKASSLSSQDVSHAQIGVQQELPFMS